MRKNPDVWENDENYRKALKIVQNINVNNDVAERGVKLIKDYNKILTRKEEGKQYLLQVVTDYRRKHPSHTKKSLVKVHEDTSSS